MRICQFEGCELKVLSKGLCASHYRQQHNGQELRPLKVYKIYARPAPGKKICTQCTRVLSIETDFYLRGNGSVQSWCKDCVKLAQKKRKERNKDKENAE